MDPGDSRFGSFQGGLTGRPDVPTQPRQAMPLTATSRWAKSSTTYGPFGRILGTTLALTPILTLSLISMLNDGMAQASLWALVGAYILLGLPFLLRDLWKPARIILPDVHQTQRPAAPRSIMLPTEPPVNPNLPRRAPPPPPPPQQRRF